MHVSAMSAGVNVADGHLPIVKSYFSLLRVPFVGVGLLGYVKNHVGGHLLYSTTN